MSQTWGYGNIDTADLKLTACSFEKDANAMVLFDKEKVFFTLYATNVVRHRRIKILNENGKEYANIRIEFDNRFGLQYITSLEAQTINLDSGKIKYSKLDPKLVYSEHTDKSKDATVFSFPNVKAGSVIEYRYTITRSISTNFPGWYFQSEIPTRYAEFDAMISPRLKFRALTKITGAFLADSAIEGGHEWALANLPSSKNEAYMRSKGDALASIALLVSSVDIMGKTTEMNNSWAWVGKQLVDDKGFYKELDQKLSGEDKLISKADSLKTDDQKIAFLFNAVKATMKWNYIEYWGTKDGIKDAWKKKTGNTAEVNAILCHLLKKSGVKAYPMLVSTRDNGLIQPGFVDIYQVNSLVTYVPVDSTKYYVLDATNKYNIYDQIPYNFLNSYGLSLNKEKDKYDMVYIRSPLPARKVVFVNATIGTDAKMQGTAQMNSFRYNRTAELELYKTSEEKKIYRILK